MTNLTTRSLLVLRDWQWIREVCWLYVSILAGVLLLTAASLKILEALAGPQSNDLNLWERLLLIGGEWILGTALVLMYRPTTTRWIAIAVFAIFAFVAMAKWMDGASSCGCFGAAVVSPTLILGVDLNVLCLLVFARPTKMPARVQRGIRLQRFAVSGSLAAVFGVALSAEARNALSMERGWTIAAASEIVGRESDLLAAVNIGDTIAHGRWVVLFYDPQCDHCREALAHVESWAADRSSPPVASVSVDSQIRLVEEPGGRKSVLIGELNGVIRWTAPTPSAVAMVEGKVVDVSGVGPADVAEFLRVHLEG